MSQYRLDKMSMWELISMGKYPPRDLELTELKRLLWLLADKLAHKAEDKQ